MISNGEYAAKFQDAGVKLVDFDVSEFALAGAKALEIWKSAASDDLSNRRMETQITLMKELRLL